MAALTNSTSHKPQPMLVVVMGVSGTGKSTLANEIANRFDFTFLDADSLHSTDAIEQMSQCIPLTDIQRAPWIERICSQLRQYQSGNNSIVLAYSGLKQQHRKLIYSAYTNTVGILLNANSALISQRMQARGEHFMPAELLSSQISAMEAFNDEIPLLTLDAGDTVEQLLLQSLTFIIENNSNRKE